MSYISNSNLGSPMGVLHAGKRIENRRWNTKYRGPILLHAAAKPSTLGVDDGKPGAA